MPESEGEGQSGQGGRNPRYLANHLDPAGIPRPDLWRQGIEDFNGLDIVASGQWDLIGPEGLTIDQDQIYQGLGPVSGEVTDIAVDNTVSPDGTIYLATNDGGIWTISQGGLVKVAATDQMRSLSMGAVAIDPGNHEIIYAGTGNLFDGGGKFTKAVGIYKSTDGGITWSILDGGIFGTLFAGRGGSSSDAPAIGINRIVLPSAGVLLVATNRGLFRSTDGGLNFGANSPKFDDGKPITLGGASGENISSLTLDTKTPGTVYACVSGKGIFKSTDSGVTFPSNLFRSDNVFAADGSTPAYPAPYTNIAFSQATKTGAADSSATMYASVQYSPSGASAVYRGLFWSSDGGHKWVLRSSAKHRANADGAGQTDYDFVLGVDPRNAQSLYLGFQELWISGDGGGSFGVPTSASGKIHWDQHALVFSPTRAYAGNDGGVATTPDRVNWDASLNDGISTCLFVGIDIGRGNATNNKYTYGGCQDTGTSGHRDGDVNGEWHSGSNGDGGPVAVDPSNPKRVYGSGTGLFLVTSDGGNNWVNGPFKGQTSPPAVGKGLPERDQHDGGTWLHLLAIDPQQTQVVYATVGGGLFQSKDGGVNFRLLRSFGLDYDQYIQSIAVSPKDSNRLWAGLRDGSVHMSADGGVLWNQGKFAKHTGGAGPAAGIAFDPADTTSNRVVVVHAGHSGINSRFRTRHAFKTEDNGVTWQDISGTDDSGPVGNLPDLPLHSVVMDKRTTPSTIIVASDGGVLSSKDLGASWQILGAGLPTVDCTSLAFDQQTGLLRVGTYGRGCWEFKKPSTQTLAVKGNLGFGTVVVGETATLDVEVFNPGSADLHISTVKKVTANAAFTIVNPPSVVPAGGKSKFSIQFKPTADGIESCGLEIDSDDAADPQHLLLASGVGTTTASVPRLAVNANLGFGEVSKQAVSRKIQAKLSNAGLSDLKINSITRTDGSSAFSLDAPPAFPVTLHPGETLDCTFKYQPGSNGSDDATFQIQSNDPRTPYTLKATGSGTGFFPLALAILLVVLGVAAVAGGAVAVYELEK